MSIPTWSILQVAVAPSLAGHNNVVKAVNWEIILKGDINFVSRVGETLLADPDNNFIPFDSLTETQVLTWVKETLGPEKVVQLETELQNELASVSSPSIIYPPLPWKF